MAFSLKINTENAAFHDDDEASNNAARAGEVARILRDIARKVEDGYVLGTAMDVNGNTVGKWSID